MWSGLYEGGKLFGTFQDIFVSVKKSLKLSTNYCCDLSAVVLSDLASSLKNNLYSYRLYNTFLQLL